MPNMEVIQCPFYITHAKSNGRWQSTVTCERIRNKMGFLVRNQLRFYDLEETETWLNMFCSCQGYTDCPYYQAIYQKYKDNPDLEPETDQYEEYEELEIRPPREEIEQISIFDYMEEKEHEDISKKIKG